MKRIFNILFCLAAITAALIGTGCKERPTNATASSELPSIFPDYADVTIPHNIAPLNFRPTAEGVEGCYAELSYAGQRAEVYGKTDISFNEKLWREILDASKGASINLTLYTKQQGKWTQWQSFDIHVSDKRIDSHLVYRLIEPGYEKWHIVGIYQRNLENFDEKPIVLNEMVGYNCINCHTFCGGDPQQMMFHMRAANGGTYITQDGKIEKLNTKTDGTISNLTYPYWHPSGRYITTSVNTIHQFFHEKGFFYFHTPIITASDCEGAGQMFQVTTKNLYDLKKDENGSIIYDDDFFGKQASLTVSGQLEGELAATALGAIYTFGPTFRAENSNTPRHLAEFWMIEPEVAFNDITDNMDLAEEFIKFCVQWALDNCADDVKFLNDMFDKGLIERLQGVLKDSFVRLPYTDGIKILEEAVAKGHKFEFPVYWGVDLASEHERYLVEEHFKRPVILTDYPKEIKAFYMKQNDDGKTVRAMDVLFPKIGEIIGGSEREADYNKLLTRIQELNIPMKDMWWYLDTRKFGSCPHSGFGLGFERLLLFVTGMSNIRDVIPFPRTPRNAEF